MGNALETSKNVEVLETTAKTVKLVQQVQTASTLAKAVGDSGKELSQEENRRFISSSIGSQNSCEQMLRDLADQGFIPPLKKRVKFDSFIASKGCLDHWSFMLGQVGSEYHWLDFNLFVEKSTSTVVLKILPISPEKAKQYTNSKCCLYCANVKCELTYHSRNEVKASVWEVMEIAQDLIENHGFYGLVGNNCQTFAKALYNKVVERPKWFPATDGVVTGVAQWTENKVQATVGKVGGIFFRASASPFIASDVALMGAVGVSVKSRNGNTYNNVPTLQEKRVKEGETKGKTLEILETEKPKAIIFLEKKKKE